MRSVVDRNVVMRRIPVTVRSKVTYHCQNPTELILDVTFHPFRYPGTRYSTCRPSLLFLLLTSLFPPTLMLRHFSTKKIDRLMTLWEIIAFLLGEFNETHQCAPRARFRDSDVTACRPCNADSYCTLTDLTYHKKGGYSARFEFIYQFKRDLTTFTNKNHAAHRTFYDITKSVFHILTKRQTIYV
jgi:hypothetical protein